MNLRYSIANWVVGADDIDEGGKEREDMSVLRRDKVRQPSIVTSRICWEVCVGVVGVCVCTCIW